MVDTVLVCECITQMPRYTYSPSQIDIANALLEINKLNQ